MHASETAAEGAVPAVDHRQLRELPLLQLCQHLVLQNCSREISRSKHLRRESDSNAPQPQTFSCGGDELFRGVMHHLQQAKGHGPAPLPSDAGVR
jgi:DNA-binding LacI/PurR family transcriptional regulator